MDYVVLAAELTNDPLGRGYASMSDSEIADSLNARDRPGRVPVPARDIRKYVLMNGLWPAIAMLAQSTEASPQARGAAITLMQTLAPNSFDIVSLDEPAVFDAVSNMADAMIAAGAITEEHRNAVLAMGNGLTSRARELGLGVVSHADVAFALRG